MEFIMQLLLFISTHVGFMDTAILGMVSYVIKL